MQDYARGSAFDIYSAKKIEPIKLGCSNSHKKAILGIGCLSHDTSVALVDFKTNKILFAQPEERFSNIKHDSGFPIISILNALRIAENENYSISSIALNFDETLYLREVIQQISLDLKDNQFEVIYEHIFNIFHQSYLNKNSEEVRNKIEVLIDSLYNSPSKTLITGQSFFYLQQFYKYAMIKNIVKQLFPEVQIINISHHKSHASSVFYNFEPKYNESTCILVLDGHGETDACSVYKVGSNNNINSFNEISISKWPYSLGSIYLSATRHLGFDYGDEFKVMGMAAYGEPKFFDLLSNIIFVDKESGQLKIIQNDYFQIEMVPNSEQVRYKFTENFHQLCKPRVRSTSFNSNDFNLASSIQALCSNIGLSFANFAYEKTGADNLYISGGVALNGLMNYEIQKKSNFKNVQIFPASGDDGTSSGAAQAISDIQNQTISNVYYGTNFKKSEVKIAIEKYSLIHTEYLDVNTEIAKHINAGKIVARFVGKAEFGPRALGNRSILANPLVPNMKDVLNSRIKQRESFRPFAPAVLAEKLNEYFETTYTDSSYNFMLKIIPAKEITKTTLPSIVHEDGTSRVQTVTKESNSSFYDLLNKFNKVSGVPILINTSFNVNGEAIVNSPEDAIESFLFMDIDFLAIDDFIISKEKNNISLDVDHAQYLEIRKNRYFKLGHPLQLLDCRKRI